ncbi:MAG: AbrB/MazE/SpoVT family DNA-binding domain-containing protein [Nanoarchaeota archaeon]
MPTVTQKSQVTIPKQFRVAAGIRPGDEVEFGIENDKLVLKKKAKRIPFEKWRGYLGKLDVNKAMEELRG